ncbi:phosphocholine cytidylyltransferase family protein [Octadecabacter sp.]|nr:phosphocholine cytidylyltransferase family protein [Octadecabacter sp.]
MKAIILSAGQGSRLLPLTQSQPKCLLEINGRSILEWQLNALAANGVNDVTVVTGFYAEEVEKLVASKNFGEQTVRTLYNPFYAVADNAGSCYVAREFMTGEFMVINGDTLFEPELAAKALSQRDTPITVTIDRKDTYDGDDMKVCLEGDQLLRIGKALPLDVVDAESIGMLMFDEEGGTHFKEAIANLLRSEGGLKRWYLQAIDALAVKKIVGTASIEGHTWQEVDFMDDLKSAEQLGDKWGLRG